MQQTSYVQGVHWLIPPLMHILQSFPPATAIQVGLAILIVVRALLLSSCAYPSHIQTHQDAKGVNISHDEFVVLFESIEQLLKPLDIYAQIPPTPAMEEMVVEIMAELLSSLALTTKELQQGRSSESLLIDILR